MKRDKRSLSESDRDKLEQQIDMLRRDIYKLQLEHDLLKKANELLKKDLGVDLQLLSNREKTMLIDALRDDYDLTVLLERLDMARSSYFYHRSPKRNADKYAEVRRAMTDSPEPCQAVTCCSHCARLRVDLILDMLALQSDQV